MRRIFITFKFLILSISTLTAQIDSAFLDNTYQLTVEEDILTLGIKNMEDQKIWSARRSSENVSETVVSSSILTDEEIKKFGITSIADALKLLPGIFVREKTNGNFSVHIIGGEDINNSLANYENTNVLVTINGIPFNDTYQGGIFWETLPVSLIDVKQIEVVQTSSASFHGTNALAGVINIVTKMTDTKYLKAHGNFQGGIPNMFSHQANASFAALDKGLFKISAFYNTRDRFQDDYYVVERNAYIPSDSLLFYQADVELTNSFTNTSLSNFGINGFGKWQVNADVNFEAMFNSMSSSVQSILQGLDQLMLSGRNTKANNMYFKAETYGLRTAFSYQKSANNLAVGYDGFEISGDKLFASADYVYSTRYANVQTGGTFQNDVYHNEHAVAENEISRTSYLHKVVHGRSQMTTYGIYLSPTVFALDGKLKTSATVRADYLQNYAKVQWSYQLGSLYKLSKKYSVRFAVSTGYQSASLMQYQYLERVADKSQDIFLQPLSYEMSSYEVGIRSKPINELYVDLTVFDKEGVRFNDFGQIGNGEENYTRRGLTLGSTLTLNKLKAKTFLTYLYTNTWNQTSPLQNKLSPAYIGGVSSSYSLFLNKLVVSANAYFYDQYMFQEYDRSIPMAGKTLVDFKASYNMFGEHTLYLVGKNLLHDTGITFPYADGIGRTLLIGVDFVF